MEEAKLTGEEKAAILLLSIDKNKVAKIFKHLGEGDLHKLTYFLANQKNVPPALKKGVLKEFYELCLAQGYVDGGGVEYARDILTEALGAQKSMDVMRKISGVTMNKPFEFLRDVNPLEVSNILKLERNQTVALVLSYMGSDQAAVVLSNIDESKQLDIVKRIAKMSKISPEVLQQVEEKMKSKLNSFFATSMGNDESMGISTVANILSSIDRNTETKIFEQLEIDDSNMAAEIKDQMFVFEDIVELDEKTVQKVVSKLQNKDIAFALKSTTEEIKEFVFANMSTRAKEMITQEIDMIGQVRISQVLEAQQKIVSTVLDMEKSGEINISKDEAEKLVG
jgi:flagellar motor switch protein FliG